MNARKVTMMAAVLSLGLFTVEESALTQNAMAMKQSHCKQVKGHQEGFFDAGTNSNFGIVTNGGKLNGTTVEAFGIGSLPTQDPTTVTFIGDFTLTTTRGQLKASNVYLFDVVSGVAAIFGRINPTTSTGRFAGATGVLYFAGKTTSFNPFTVEAEITGEICFANANKAREWDDWR
jgi:hypothetical protein